jgi:hypothetical protein
MHKSYVSMMVWVWVAFFMMIGCGGSKYGDLEATLDTEIDVMSTFVADMEKAGDAGAVAAAIQTYAAGMEKLIPELKAITEKYPNMATLDDASDDLKAKITRVEQLSGQFQATMMKAAGYMINPEVQKAWQDFGKVMEDLNRETS